MILAVKDQDRKIDIAVAGFQRYVYVAYAMMVCKSQGSTFYHPCTIQEWEGYANRLKRGSLSRASSKELSNLAHSMFFFLTYRIVGMSILLSSAPPPPPPHPPSRNQ